MYNPPPRLFFNNAILEQNCTKFLGVMPNNNLCFQKHIDCVTKYYQKTFQLMLQRRHNMPAEALKSVYVIL